MFSERRDGRYRFDPRGGLYGGGPKVAAAVGVGGPDTFSSRVFSVEGAGARQNGAPSRGPQWAKFKLHSFRIARKEARADERLNLALDMGGGPV